MANTAKFEEGSEIIVDSTVETAAAGWTLNYASVNRTGNLVFLHVEVAFAAAAALLVTTLGADFAPGATVTTADGKFTVAANGQVHYTGSTGSSGTAVLDIGYQAGLVSP